MTATRASCKLFSILVAKYPIPDIRLTCSSREMNMSYPMMMEKVIIIIVVISIPKHNKCNGDTRFKLLPVIYILNCFMQNHMDAMSYFQ